MDKYLQRLQVNLHWVRVWLYRRIFAMSKPVTIDDIEILYKSTNFIVVNKHCDVKINSNEIKDTITVATQLAHLFPDLVDASIGHQFRFVHRLDYSTSGTLCVALNKKASADAMKRFQRRQVTKCYYALVRGHVQPDYLMIDKPVYTNKADGYTHMMCVEDGDSQACQPEVKILSATTELYVMQRGFYDGRPASKVLLKPLTGRRHQLRVHCLSVGHPIVGDYTYSLRQDVKPYRMMLHSQRLTIPAKSETIDVEAPDPLTPEKDPKWCPVELIREESSGKKQTSNEETVQINRYIDGPVQLLQEESSRESTQTSNERTIQINRNTDTCRQLGNDKITR